MPGLVPMKIESIDKKRENDMETGGIWWLIGFQVPERGLCKKHVLAGWISFDFLNLAKV